MFNGRLLSFTQLFACIFLYCVLIQGWEQAEGKVTPNLTQQINGASDLKLRLHERKRRSPNDKRRTCGSKMNCKGNTTSFETEHYFNCHCDNACYEVFSDCCPDYEEYCGRQKPDKNVDKNVWKCVKLGIFNGLCKVIGASGVWMIEKCPRNWPSDDTRKKCEIPKIVNVMDSIPVVGDNTFTYRNKHCAVCHGLQNYSSWNIRVFTFIIPPDALDLESKLVFIVRNGGRLENRQPRLDQPRRYCAGENYIDNCTDTKHIENNKCIHGPVEVVSGYRRKYYKNHACGSCNGEPGLTRWGITGVCGLIPEGFSLVFNVRQPRAKPSTTVVSKFCPKGTVFDKNLELCRKGYIAPPESELSNEFLIVLWFEKFSIKTELNSTLASNLKSALTANFSLLPNDVSAITFHSQDIRNFFIVATLRLTLTPFQSLIFANQNRSAFNITRGNTAFLTLLNSTAEAFTLSWNDYTFSVVKVTSSQLACYDGKRFRPHEYTIDNKKFLVNKTDEVYLLSDYTLLKNEGGNVTLCRKLVLSGCVYGAYVPLSPDEYVTFPNLTLYHNATNSTFEFGEYLLSESFNERNISNTTQNSVLSRNWTVAVCLPFKNSFNETETKYSASTTSYGLRIVTLVGFSISTVCHSLLLITYGLFQEFRSVPGLNLMSLSFSMLLSQVIWLVGTAHLEGTVVCEVFAILEHYLLQVSFLAMSIISYHSCHVLSRPIMGRTVNTSRGRFIKYSAFVWLSAATFVAICVILDKTETLLVNYGTNCWLGTANAKLYLFLLPLAVLLLYNIYKFIRTAVSLSRHDKERRKLQQKERKQSLLICTKLATLVGFPWLFAFLGVLFPDVEAFEYLFVVCVCLQGVCIAMVFVFKKKILKLYYDRWNKRKINIGSPPGNGLPTSPTPPSFELS